MTRLLDRRPGQTSASDATCPLRPGDGCRMCVPGAAGPWDCGLVQLVLSDPELGAQLRTAVMPN